MSDSAQEGKAGLCDVFRACEWLEKASASLGDGRFPLRIAWQAVDGIKHFKKEMSTRVK